ncbi:DUF1501 domain-containing protein [Falsihalocynthiibacter sp. SS001]|uniref:DUF1501 domain-containing protein n=1 Tax=Falsihalocynthiibacter sp. SS001 TaxID=3349698 RepID=UPI0036D28A4E
MTNSTLSRRDLLIRASALGCSAAASPLLTPISLAATPSDQRLVVIILRGGMDGLDVVQPVGDKGFGKLRPTLSKASKNAKPLTGMFALHPALAPLMPLWKSEQLAFAHAVSTPYRDKRSHFAGQDILEAGTAGVDNGGVRGGWLNRLLQTIPDADYQTAYSVGREEMLVLKGKADVSSWAPDARMDISDPTKLLLGLTYQDDPLFMSSLDDAFDLTTSLEGYAEMPSDLSPTEAMQFAQTQAKKMSGYKNIAAFTAARLREETRIASFSITGWDTHRNQAGSLKRALGNLSDVILKLQQDLGPVWDKTTIIAMTEFGRTARENGTQGTDHGTGGLSVMAGGALRGGKVYGDWPGLKDADLYQGRDLMPTQDVRAYAAMAMRGLFGTSVSTLEQQVFPGLDLKGAAGIIS